KNPPRQIAETQHMADQRKPSPAPGGPSYGMARASVHSRRRATAAVRSLTVAGAVGAVAGSAYLTVALVPAADASNASSSTQPVAGVPSTTAAMKPPSSLTATKRATTSRPARKTRKATGAGPTSRATVARTKAAAPTTTAPAPTTAAPAPVQAPPKQAPVVGSGGS
ncbi:MAG: hypothetical protein QOE76_3859, partial [Frankiales bacterium]|nr:hypothetical protein [Frankiales bacterium]